MPVTPAGEGGYSVGGYFALLDTGAIDEGDHVELLEGLVVASPPQGPLHAAVTMAVDQALRAAFAGRASIRVQMPLVVGDRSVPEPDLAVVAGTPVDYRDRHPEAALLVVEIADSTLAQERLTKSRIYASAAVPEYWIVNLRDRRVEVFTNPEPGRRIYLQSRDVALEGAISLRALPELAIPVRDLFPGY